MKTLRQVEIEPVFVDFIPETKDMEQGKVYVSKEFKTASHLCLCGCGRIVVTPLNPEHGWTLTEHSTGKISLSPSIGNYQFPCQSHYIITKNKANFV